MRFCDRPTVASMLEGKTVAIVGSGPGSLGNPHGLVDSHDVVVRVNNYKLFPATGTRTDVFYSFFGASIKKTAEQLQRDGVKLCMCKCPNAKFMESPWHERNGKTAGIDFRWIYERRASWWFCDTYVPTTEEFMAQFDLLGRHVPTTGFAALLDVLAHRPGQIFLTGFDFFTSRIHNVNERWSFKNTSDPIGHVPECEREWLTKNLHRYPIRLDAVLSKMMETT